MADLVSLVQLLVIAVGLGWLGLLLATPRKNALHLVWGVFCGSLCLLMIKSAFATELGDYRYLVGMGACATCNVFWLVARAVFRPGRPFNGLHVAVAAAVGIPIALGQFLQWIATPALAEQPLFQLATGGLSEWVQLLSSGLLLLAFWEAFRSRAAGIEERRLRRGFMITYASCVLACTVWTSPTQDASSALNQVEPLLQALSALAILLVAGQAVRYRSRHPLPESETPVATEMPRLAAEEDLELARRIEHCVQHRALYLDPELKVADLADALQTPEYKISRAISLGLGQANFNRYINAYRIDHAKRLLADPRSREQSVLAIGMDCGFASIGPFNRAFKAATGQTPSAYRKASLDGDAVSAA